MKKKKITNRKIKDYNPLTNETTYEEPVVVESPDNV
jgi:hypothetical protein